MDTQGFQSSQAEIDGVCGKWGRLQGRYSGIFFTELKRCSRSQVVERSDAHKTWECHSTMKINSVLIT